MKCNLIRRAAAVAAVAALSCVLVACRGLVDDIFDGEDPQDGTVDYALQIVRTDSSTDGINHLVETTAPSKSYLAVRVLHGTLDGLDPALSTTDSFCATVESGVHRLAISVHGDNTTNVVAGLFRPDDTADASEASSADAATSADSCGETCVQALVFGICPKGVLEASIIHPLLIPDDAAPAAEAPDADAEASLDADADDDAADAGDEQ